MKKWFLKGLVAFLAISAPVALTSCSFFTDPDDGITIKRVDHKENDDKSVTITIVYENENKADDIFVIPASVGIVNVTANYDEITRVTTVFVTTTDGIIRSFSIPPTREILRLETEEVEDGLEIFAVYSAHDENGMVAEIREYVGLVLKGPAGADGKDGRGIANIETEVDDVTGLTTVKIYFDDQEEGEEPGASFPIPAGRGVEEISYEIGGDGQPVLLITMSNGDTYVVPVPRQAGWFQGQGHPNYQASLTPVDGDFYYDTRNNAIYTYEFGYGWVLVVSISDMLEERYTVSFDLNVTDGSAEFGDGVDSSYRIRRGMSFLDEGYAVPVPTRDGFNFAGWYGTRTTNATSGMFTDIVSVWSNLTLYAKWTAKSDTYTVTFDLNVDDDSAHFEDGVASEYAIHRGSTFLADNKEIPVPVRDGYTFEGWYTKAVVDVTAGLFTDLTPVQSNMILYANWALN